MRNRVKIIHIMDNLGVSGGVNSFVYDLCYALKEQGSDVSLIGILDSEDKNNAEVVRLRNQGIEVVCLEAKNKKDAILHYAGILRKTINQLSNGNPTICNLHLKLSVLLGGIATIRMRNVKCVETYHSQYSHYSLEYNLMKHRISFYIPCSESAGVEMKERFHVPQRKMRSIPNGINASEIKRTVPKENENTTFLSVGRLTAQKNYPVIIEAFNKLNCVDVDYLIIGNGEDKEVLKQKASSNSIQFLGTMDRKSVLSYTAGADMVCMPSLWEGLSIYMMEAFSLGRPMMLSDIPSFREAVGEKKLEKELYRKCEWGYLVTIIATLTNFVSSMISFFGLGTGYVTTEIGNAVNVGIMSLLYFALLLLRVFGFSNVYNLTEEVNNTENTAYKDDFYTYCIALSLAVTVMSLRAAGMSRLNIYLQLVGLPYISNIMNRIKNQRVAVIVKASFSVVIWSYSVIALVYRPEWQHIWPYHFYWQ